MYFSSSYQSCLAIAFIIGHELAQSAALSSRTQIGRRSSTIPIPGSSVASRWRSTATAAAPWKWHLPAEAFVTGKSIHSLHVLPVAAAGSGPALLPQDHNNISENCRIQGSYFLGTAIQKLEQLSSAYSSNPNPESLSSEDGATSDRCRSDQMRLWINQAKSLCRSISRAPSRLKAMRSV